jgi:hypothetical protein
MTRRGRGASGGRPAESALSTASPGSWQRDCCNVAAPHGDRGGTLARRSHSRQPGHGRVDPARQRGDRMAHYDGA